MPNIYKTKIIDCGNHIRTITCSEFVSMDYKIEKKSFEKSSDGFKSSYSIRRSLDDVCLTIDSNVTKYSKFITLTFKENVLDREIALEYFNQFKKNFKRLFKQAFKYIAITERQSDRGIKNNDLGSWHFHIVSFNEKKLNFNLLKKAWSYGSVDIRIVNNSNGLALYLTKYLSKQLKEKKIFIDLNDKIVLKSYGLKKPIEYYDKEIPESYSMTFETDYEYLDEKTGLFVKYTFRDYYKDTSYFIDKNNGLTPALI